MNAYAIPGINRKQTNLNLAEFIIDTVAMDWNIDREKLFEPTRQQRYVIPRHICMYLLRKKLKMNYCEVGRIFLRDHTCIIHAQKVITNYIESRVDNPIKIYLNSKSWL
jgi:chromosomal replication initiator protein